MSNDSDVLICAAAELCREMFDPLDMEDRAAITACAAEVASIIGRVSRDLASCGCGNPACFERQGEDARALLIAMMACSAIMRGHGRDAVKATAGGQA